MDGSNAPHAADERHRSTPGPVGRKIGRLIWGGCIILALTVTSGVAAPKSKAKGERKHKADFALRKAVERDEVTPVRVIIRVGKVKGQRNLIKQLLRQRGGIFHAEYYGTNAILTEVHPRLLDKLEDDPRILSVSIDAPARGFSAEADDAGLTYSLRGALGLVGDMPVTGAGVGVAMVDTGIDAESELAAQVSAFYDFTKGGIATPPADPHGHGTHIAGLIAGAGAEDPTTRGVAPGVRLIGLKVLGDGGGGSSAAVMAALEFAAANKDALGIDILNMSLGHLLKGAAAKNGTLYKKYLKLRRGNKYIALCGTSMAAGVVSGPAALVIEAHRQAHPDAPPLTPNAIKAILMYTASPLVDATGVPYEGFAQGVGSLNPIGAMQLASAIDTTAPLGTNWLTTSVDPVTTSPTGEALLWANNIVWGNNVVWGDMAEVPVEPNNVLVDDFE